MSAAKIAERETERYALEQPDMIRVSIEKGILIDNRDKHYELTRMALKKGADADGQCAS